MIDSQSMGVETLQMILDNMQATVYVTDAETYEIIFANKFLKMQFGDDVLGKPCYSGISKFDKPCPWCHMSQVKELPIGTPHVWEDRNLEMDMWLNVEQTIVKWPDGRNAHIAVLRDISGIKENEERLKEYKVELEQLLAEKTENEQMLKSISDNLPGSFVFQFRGDMSHLPRLTYISSGVKELCGMTAEDFRDDPLVFVRMFDPRDAQMIMDHVRKGSDSFSYETKIMPMNGKDHVWLLFSGVLRKADDGELIMDGMAVDITARKEMEAELQKSQEELLHNAALMREVSSNMVNSALYRSHIDKIGNIHLDFASEQIEKITGVSKEELFADLKNCFRFVHPDDKDFFMSHIAASSLSMADDNVEFRYEINGQTKWYKMQSKAIMQDGVLYRDGMVIDITSHKVLEEQLIKARDKAEESDKLKSTFLANMSHEIRTPMNAIIGFLEFLSSDDDIPRDMQKEYMRIVSDNANQLLKLIGDILDISKIDAGQMKIVPEQSNVNMLLLDIRTSFIASGAIPAEKQIELIVDDSGQDADGTFTIDSARLRQILNNMIGNAIKFTDKGHVKFGYNVTPEGLKFYVEDTGIGISKAKLEDLGKPFHQLHDVSQSAKYGGTGIGMAISINLVKLMGGMFKAQSEEGKGTRFEFIIPCKEIFAADEPELEDSAMYDLTGRTILIVEDIDSNLSFLRTLLRQSNATLLTAADGNQAVEIVKTHPEIELVLMDVRMPVMDGLTATKRIKVFRPNLPVVGQTAYVSPEDQRNMHEAGFDDFIPKPVKRLLLQEKINKFLNI